MFPRHRGPARAEGEVSASAETLRGRWLSHKNTTSAEGNSTPVGHRPVDAALLAAVPSPCDACQHGEASAEQEYGGGLRNSRRRRGNCKTRAQVDVPGGPHKIRGRRFRLDDLA